VRASVIRVLALLLVLGFFQGWFGVVAVLLIALAYEVVGASVGTLWASAVVALAAAPLVTVVRVLVLRPLVGAPSAQANVAARGLVSFALALAVYAAVAELTATRRQLAPEATADPPRLRRPRPPHATPGDRPVPAPRQG